MVEKREEQKIVEISYHQFDGLMHNLVRKVNRFIDSRKTKFTGFYGIPRGGLPIAVHLSHHCNLPLLNEPKRNCIIVEDIIDSGSSTCVYYKKYPIVSLFYKKGAKTKPTIGIREIRDKDWIVFSWELRK